LQKNSTRSVNCSSSASSKQRQRRRRLPTSKVYMSLIRFGSANKTVISCVVADQPSSAYSATQSVREVDDRMAGIPGRRLVAVDVTRLICRNPPIDRCATLQPCTFNLRRQSSPPSLHTSMFSVLTALPFHNGPSQRYQSYY